MRTSPARNVIRFAMLTLALLAVGCKHPVATAPAAAPAPPAPAPAQPTVTLSAAPSSIRPGQSVTLTWSSTNATSLTLDQGIGSVSPEGSNTVTPTSSVTYTITATGPGGSAQSTARVTVTAPPPAETSSQPSLDELFSRSVMDAYFDLDRADIRGDARDALNKTGEFLKSYPQIKVTIEGHCDERGSTEYNLALGDRRAQAAKEFLVSLGVAADRMMTVSYGKEKPFCTEHSEECWKQNRRAHFVMGK
jgi:peptidoglycan-associated lipoprotein